MPPCEKFCAPFLVSSDLTQNHTSSMSIARYGFLISFSVNDDRSQILGGQSQNESYRASFEICSNSEDVFVECKDRFL